LRTKFLQVTERFGRWAVQLGQQTQAQQRIAGGVAGWESSLGEQGAGFVAVVIKKGGPGFLQAGLGESKALPATISKAAINLFLQTMIWS
jgi:hypothetical protein